MNLGGTHFASLLNNKSHDKCHPERSATIADCPRLTTQQLFDVAALVQSISSHTPVIVNRAVFDVEIIGGSEIENQVRTMPLAVFTQRPSLLSADAPQ